jgi:spermidine synthase
MLLRLAIGLLSGGAIAYQILLTRIFSIVQWHHFAALVISLALLGYAASGTFLSVFRQRLLNRFAPAFLANAVGFALLAVVATAAAQRVPFNPLETLWDARQLGYLAGVYLILALPFFCAANAIGLAFMRLESQIHLIYRADLIGAGFGALVIVGLLFILPVSQSLLVVATAGFAAAALAALDPALARRRRTALALALVGAVSPLLWPSGWSELRLSDFKGLRKTLAVPGAEIVKERSSPLGLLTVVRSTTIPFRFAPGLSFNYPQEPPEQLGLFTDGDALAVIDRADPQDRLAYLDYLPPAIAYHLLERPRVAILGTGGGRDVLSALLHGAREVHAVEANPQRLRLLRADFADFSGHIYRDPRVRLHNLSSRGFLASSRDRFDLIQMSVAQAGSTAIHSLSEDFLFTVQSFEAALERLRPAGLVSVSGPVQAPPRYSLKLLATATEALGRLEGADAGRQVALIHSWSTFVLLVKKSAFTDDDRDTLRRFCAARSFDLGFYPGMPESEANRFHVLEEAALYRGARELLGADGPGFLDRYKFYIEPATDERPYFFDFFKWSSLAELLRLRQRGAAPLIEWGYILLVAALFQAALGGFLLILLPLLMLGRRSPERSGAASSGVYFLALGLAFLFVEIAFIQRFTLFLAHPLYALAVVLASFLFFAGLGSGFSGRWNRNRDRDRKDADPSPITRSVAGIAALAFLYLAALPPLFTLAAAWPTPLKVLLSLVLLAPLAFLMGMPFPLGLRLLSRYRPALVPWAWGVNGWASVLSALLATLLALHLGFSVVILTAIALYGLAALTGRRLERLTAYSGSESGRNEALQ